MINFGKFTIWSFHKIIPPPVSRKSHINFLTIIIPRLHLWWHGLFRVPAAENKRGSGSWRAELESNVGGYKNDSGQNQVQGPLQGICVRLGTKSKDALGTTTLGHTRVPGINYHGLLLKTSPFARDSKNSVFAKRMIRWLSRFVTTDTLTGRGDDAPSAEIGDDFSSSPPATGDPDPSVPHSWSPTSPKSAPGMLICREKRRKLSTKSESGSARTTRMITHLLGWTSETTFF